MRQITYKEILDIDVDNEVVVSVINDEYRKALSFHPKVVDFKPWQKFIVRQVTRFKMATTPTAELWVGKITLVGIPRIGYMPTTEDTLWYRDDGDLFLPIAYADLWDKVGTNSWHYPVYEVK